MIVMLAVIFAMSMNAQKLAVESFALVPNDLSAQTNERLDLNGKPCALLKISVMDDIVGFEGSVVGKIDNSGVTKKVYVTSRAPFVTLEFKYHYPVTIKFEDYGFKYLEGRHTYKVMLVDAGQAGAPAAIGQSSQQASELPQQNVMQAEQPSLVASAEQNSQAEPITAEQMLERGKQCFENKDYTEAAEWYRKAADQNLAEAQHMLGICYEAGYGVSKNQQVAIGWVRKAADKNFAISQMLMGSWYMSGHIVKKDRKEAVRWYRKAAEQGNADAQLLLGNCYLIGAGVSADRQEAVAMYRKSAEQNNAAGQLQMGLLYDYGLGVKKDHMEAANWYRKAAEQGLAEAQYRLGKCYEDGDGVSRDLSEAIKWYRKAAEQGHPKAQKKQKKLRW